MPLIRQPLPDEMGPCCWQTRDVVEHSHWPGTSDLCFKQVSAGRFAGRIASWALPGVRIIREQSNQALIKSGSTLGDCVVFSMPLHTAGDATLRYLGHEFRTPQLLATHARALPDVGVSAGVDVLCAIVDQALLEDAVCHSGHDLPDGIVCQPLDDSGCWHDLVRIIYAFTRPDARGELEAAGEPVIRRQARDTIVSCLLDMSVSHRTTGISPTTRKRIVDRACAYAMAQDESPPTILDLCRQVGASRRKLQYCFQHVIGINPDAYLRILRLNAVHRALIEVESPVRVGDLAHRWGFMHLSRFAADYRRLFGELPSATRQRVWGTFAEFG